MSTWLDSEPVRTRAYPLVAAMVAYLAIRGVIDGDAMNMILAVAGTIFGATATETARAQVTPAAHIAVAAKAAIEQVRGQVGESLGQPGLDALEQLEATLPLPRRHAA